MEYEEEISLQDPVQLLRRGLVFALAVALGAAGLTYYLSRRMTPEYDSTATLLVSRPGSAQGTFGVSLVTAPTIDITAYQAAAKSYPVLSTALETLGVHDAGVATVGAFSKVVSVRAESAQQSSLLRVTVRDADPAWAAEAANALGNALLGWDVARAKQNLQVLIATLQSQIDAFDAEIVGASTGVGSDASQSTQVEGIKALRADRANQLNAVRALSASAVGLLEVLEPAMPALRPSRPQTRAQRCTGLHPRTLPRIRPRHVAGGHEHALPQLRGHTARDGTTCPGRVPATSIGDHAPTQRGDRLPPH